MLYVRQAIRLAGQVMELPGWPNWVCDRSRRVVLRGLANPRARFRRRLPHALTRGQIVWVLYGQASRAISIG